MINHSEGAFEVRANDALLRVEAWGTDGVRVRSAVTRIVDGLPGALLDRPEHSGVTVDVADGQAVLTNGRLRVELSAGGRLRFIRAADGVELLAENSGHFAWPGPRSFTPAGNGHYRLEQRFAAYDDEHVFGLGQHTHGLLDQKGAVIDLVQRNGEVTIPFMVSSRGYGVLWNNPAIGRVELAATGTRWVADSGRQIDYWVTAGDRPADILSNYADATGHSPMMPEWAAGFWQSRLRYRTQDELLEVAREFKSRGLPLSVIVCDYFHWTHLGDWRFDPAEWPDPNAMVEELDEMGVKLLVSVWPSVSPLSENYAEMRDAGLLIGTEQGAPVHHMFPDKGFGDAKLGVAFYDPTNPLARSFVWDAVRRNYHEHGVKLWWLDACEPEIFPEQFANLRFYAGPGLEVANLYPREHARAFYEGMSEAGETEIVSLIRSAWAGSQRYGAALWSGDIQPTFDSLRRQIRAGLNVAMSGLSWWNTDIGGFHGGDPDSPEYRELMIRWFQYGVFCPLTRLHGHREPRESFVAGHAGGPNEIWSYGEEAYAILRGLLELRERLRPYILAHMRVAHETGLPPMRPVFVDYPADDAAWSVDDQFMFGTDLLIAPVAEAHQREREVYLPAGSEWIDTATGEQHAGGSTITCPAPLEWIPVFLRAGSELDIDVLRQH